MPATPRARRGGQGQSHANEHALAARVAQTLETEFRRNGNGNGSASHHSALAETEMLPEPQGAVQPEAEAVEVERAAPKAKAKSQAPNLGLPNLLTDSLARLTATFSGLQEAARETAFTIASQRLTNVQNVGALQRKVLEITQANIGSAIDHAQKMMHAADVGEALKLQAGYAQTAFKSLTNQTDELRAMSVRMAHAAGEPLAKGWNETLGRFRGTRDE